MRRHLRELSDHPARLLDAGSAMRTYARQVRFDFRALLALKHAEGVLFVKRGELFAIHHERVSSRDSRRRSRPPRIQLFTVPSGWPMTAEISLCVRPSKK